jgi:hypothetical protein
MKPAGCAATPLLTVGLADLIEIDIGLAGLNTDTRHNAVEANGQICWAPRRQDRRIPAR